jgi:hypothetical protein
MAQPLLELLPSKRMPAVAAHLCSPLCSCDTTDTLSKSYAEAAMAPLVGPYHQPVISNFSPIEALHMKQVTLCKPGG